MIVKITLYMDGEGHFRLDDGRMLDELNPKEMLLYAAADCAGRTIVSLLEEHTSTLKSLTITLEGTLSTPTVIAESKYTSFNIIYAAECPTLKDQIVISRAVNLAHDKYCGLVQMLRCIAPLTHKTSTVSTGGGVKGTD
ncbi:MAG: OsmC family protein [Alistipes sp.]|nr:OsmC family protein [Alistipes sp.]